MKKLSERDADMLESIEMWLHEIEPKFVKKELEWLNQIRFRLLEEESDKSLEEAAEEYEKNRGPALDSDNEECRRAFKAGAKWMAEQGAQLIGRIKVNGMGQPYLPPEYIYLSGLDLKEGDKVIVQIRKKED